MDAPMDCTVCTIVPLSLCRGSRKKSPATVIRFTDNRSYYKQQSISQ